MSECSVTGCPRKMHARGFCTLHYNRWKRHGDPTRATVRWVTDLTAGTKLCSRCHESKPLGDFRWSASRGGTGHESMCKPCKTAYSRERNRAKYRDDPVYRERRKREMVAARWPSRDRDRWLKRVFGIGAADYDAMLAAQGNVCAICGTTNPGGRWGTFCVDHDHYTGRVRGLLCHKCNMGLGAFGDNAEHLTEAAAYLIGARQHARAS